MRFSVSWYVLSALCLPLAAAHSSPIPYNAIYAFGDSLTDTGRQPAEPLLHYEGRWSNGPLWVEYLSRWVLGRYDADNNFARSGAQTDDTHNQVLAFTPTNDISHALFVVWAGGNDFLQEYDTHWFNDSSWNQQIAYSVGSLSNAVVNLYDKGARFILVPNTVDVTRIPSLNQLPGLVRDYLRGKVEQFNAQLGGALAQVQAARPDLILYPFDFYSRVNALLANAAAYGFTETEIDALADVSLVDKSFDGPGANYVFWDPIHPTTKAHRIVAGWFQKLVYPLQSRVAMRLSQGVPELSVAGLDVGSRYVIRRTSDLITWSDFQPFTVEDPFVTLVLTNDRPFSFFSIAPE
ncbi:MAG TPA: SGNH/GDSL hydrolase family protein [Verrucomicrobiae bacterium]|nr:SGNH/GDSL hydrolase family protein [Verrucomicrobiae bacterium]